MHEQEEEECSFIPSSTKEYWGFSLLSKCSDSSGEWGRLEFTYMWGCLWKHKGPKVSREVFTCVHRNVFVKYLPRYMKKCVHVLETACEALRVWVLLCACTCGKTQVKEPLTLLQGAKSINQNAWLCCRVSNLSKCLQAKRLWLSPSILLKTKPHKLGNIFKAEIIFLQF